MKVPEVELLHPLVALYLLDTGYRYLHQPNLLGVARDGSQKWKNPDFVAEDRTGTRLVIECKMNCHNWGKTYAQLMGYVEWLVPGFFPALAVPTREVHGNPFIGQICATWRVHLLCIDDRPERVAELRPQIEALKALPYLGSALDESGNSLMGEIVRHPPQYQDVEWDEYDYEDSP